MSGVLVCAETRSGDRSEPGRRAIDFELIAAGRALSEQGAGPLAVALIGAGAEAHAEQLDVDGVEQILVVPTALEHFEAHVTQAALQALIEQHCPAVVLAAHTVDSLSFAPALAARGGHGFASDVLAATWQEDGLHAERGAFAERLIAELDFPGKQTVVLLLRTGAFASPHDSGGRPDGQRASVTRVELDLDAAARSERVELREAPVGDVDIAKADFLLAIGRGVGSAEKLAQIERLAELMGATLAVSGPLVEAGWGARTRKVGQSGRTVAPRVYLALGISGAAQHLAGMSRSRTIVAVNSDPDARIFDVAHYGAVADLFEVADALERQLGNGD
ncbi:MAG TPA: electron transfer flavoprotein subunit alpha/FixB family protein [Solirubrobacteraceae bacterium]|jgi:electron transfer flavoprotein alpha subunit|nr:electron transfer flavoprotein subunit alpha/FixB family protein [Solirubrobacteraceae bacterium]